MSAPSFGLGHASDALISITCPGIKAISLTGRELRREAKREQKQKREKRQAAKRPVVSASTAKGFGG